ncbi:hypothetical protein ZHAS_00013171 [Anopheles sinensis]|uniref:Uncharacterized protein n=1 Tax=Anopheles sinensis TaxID=74873 RepID=A0A084W4R3_ANOSI|nr:hypothetical protein ZHAS_00013171 [Anopheles sinensis]
MSTTEAKDSVKKEPHLHPRPDRVDVTYSDRTVHDGFRITASGGCIASSAVESE